MKVSKKQYRALKGLTLPSKDGDVRVEAGELIPVELLRVVPELWLGTKVEEA